MPKSRRRQSRGRGRTKRSAKRKTGKKNVVIAAAIAGVLVVVAGAYLITKSGGDGEGSEFTTTSGLKYADLVVGSGESPSPGRSVTVHYTGTLENGTQFDSSRDKGIPFTFIIGRGAVIAGWDEGVMSMKVGGRRRLVIPPALGYGARGSPPNIPPNSTLIFDVELLSVK